MSKWVTYTRKGSQKIEVKRGFNWAAFFFGPLWFLFI